jgi:hypothetical protein
MVAAVAIAAVAGGQPVRAADIPAVAQGVQAFPGTGAVLVTWGGVTGATGYNVYRRAHSAAADTAVKVNAEPTPYTWLIDNNQGQGLANGTPLVYSVKAVLPSGEGAASAEAVVTPQVPVLGSLFLHNIGTPTPGSVTVEGDVLTIMGSGADIWDQTDQGAFLGTAVAGDYTITAKLNEKPTTTGTDNAAKVGVMIRDRLASGARYAYAFASVERTPEFMFEGRTDNPDEGIANFSGGLTSFDEATFPIWLRLTKTGNAINAFQSTDGSNFEEILGEQLYRGLPAVTYAGIAATAHQEGSLVTGKIDLNSIKIETP